MTITIEGVPWHFRSEDAMLRVLAWFAQRSA
jgi:hypothetical protein